jgi:hypothetical protein
MVADMVKLTRRNLISAAPLLGIGVWGGLLLQTSPAIAQVPPAALQAYAAGNYADAARLGEASANADGLAFAARARLATGLLSGASRISRADMTSGKALAERALRLSPNHVEGRLQLAIALGLEARRMSQIAAFTRGLPQRVRRLIDGVCTDAPREPWGFAMRGIWHLEGLRLAGEDAARLLGARQALGIAAFVRATSLSTSPTFPAMHAISLLALNPRTNKTAIAGPLATAIGRAPSIDFDREMHRRTVVLNDLIARNDAAGIDRQLALWL